MTSTADDRRDEGLVLDLAGFWGREDDAYRMPLELSEGLESGGPISDTDTTAPGSEVTGR
jgi:hypothetical protein